MIRLAFRSVQSAIVLMRAEVCWHGGLKKPASERTRLTQLSMFVPSETPTKLNCNLRCKWGWRETIVPLSQSELVVKAWRRRGEASRGWGLAQKLASPNGPTQVRRVQNANTGASCRDHAGPLAASLQAMAGMPIRSHVGTEKEISSNPSLMGRSRLSSSSIWGQVDG